MQTKRQNKLTKRELKSLLAGSIIAAFLVSSPYLFYLYKGFPDVQIWETSFFGIHFTYNSNYYESVYVLAWTIFAKIFPLMYLSIWFFTCKHWWYHAILIPMAMYIFQIYGTLDDDLRFSDFGEIYVLAPLILIALLFIYGIRMRIFDRIHGVDYSELKRVTFKGKIKEKNKRAGVYMVGAEYLDDYAQEPDAPSYQQNYDDDDEDDEPLYMG